MIWLPRTPPTASKGWKLNATSVGPRNMAIMPTSSAPLNTPGHHENHPR